MSDQTVITLQYPRNIGNRKIESISIRRPRVRDMKLLDNFKGIDGSIKMLSQLSGEDVALIEELDSADFMAATEVIEGFFPDSQAGTN